MSARPCACGYEAAGADDLRDHLLEVFTPADDRDDGGAIHAEAASAEPALACLCGYAAGDIPGLDAHFLAVFAPADGIADGTRHAPVGTPPPATP